MAHRREGQILPFRIPFFRIFYSTTYTVLYIIIVAVLAITPISLLWDNIQHKTWQYTFMIGGTYVLTILCAIFIYSSRLYTNRSVLASVGKAYIPIEEGEVGKSVRKMIVRQLERSAIIAWESRPRDLYGEILLAEDVGVLPQETASTSREDYTVGREITVDPAAPPWGVVEHEGWSSPSHARKNQISDMQFAPVILELPNLIEAKAVSVAPADPTTIAMNGAPMADAAVVELLRRPETMGIRDYLTQLSYLGLVKTPELGQLFLSQYEHARFNGLPISQQEFDRLMATFADLLAGMTSLDGAMIEQIRLHTSQQEHPDYSPKQAFDAQPTEQYKHASTQSPYASVSNILRTVTARTQASRNATLYPQQSTSSIDSFSSVIHNAQDGSVDQRGASLDLTRSTTFASDIGSVVHRSIGSEHG